MTAVLNHFGEHFGVEGGIRGTIFICWACILWVVSYSQRISCTNSGCHVLINEQAQMQ